MKNWKENILDDYDLFDQLILQLAGGDPERIRRYRQDFTYSEIARAWQSRLISGE